MNTVLLAKSLLKMLKSHGFSPPDSVVPDPNGGIVFERRKGDVSEVFHVWDDGEVDYMRFNGCRLIERVQLVGEWV